MSDRRRATPKPGSRPTGRGASSNRYALPSDVVDELRRASRGGGEEALTHLEEAVQVLSRGDVLRAVRSAQRAKALAPRSATVREVLGLSFYGGERYKEALGELLAYKRMSGRLDQNHVAADCQRALGHPEKAVELADQALDARLPDEVRAEGAIVGASALADMGRTDEALAFLRRFRTRTEVGREHDLRVWYVAGDILARAGRKADAAREFKKVLRHDPAAFDAAERLSQLD